MKAYRFRRPESPVVNKHLKWKPTEQSDQTVNKHGLDKGFLMFVGSQFVFDKLATALLDRINGIRIRHLDINHRFISLTILYYDVYLVVDIHIVLIVG